jgi:hypothetical protein
MKLDTKRKAVRQGDVLVLPITALPPKTLPVQPENGRLVLAHGEATGHHHSFAFSERVALFREDGGGGGLFGSVTGHAAEPLEHQEHAALPVSPGPIAVIRQRTYVASIARRVAD